MDVKLGILTALWGRPALTSLFLDRMGVLIKKHGVNVVAVGSEPHVFSKMCNPLGVIYVNTENKPLGAKWNAGLAAFKDIGITHVMILGSDDFVSDSLIEYSLENLSKGLDFFGSKGLWIFGARKDRKGFGQLFYFKYGGYLVGPARCFSRKLIEVSNWKLWDGNKNSGLDGSAANRVRANRWTKSASYDAEKQDLLLIDIKTCGNISGIPGGAKPRKDVVGLLTRHLPGNESENIINLLKRSRAL